MIKSDTLTVNYMKIFKQVESLNWFNRRQQQIWDELIQINKILSLIACLF